MSIKDSLQIFAGLLLAITVVEISFTFLGSQDLNETRPNLLFFDSFSLSDWKIWYSFTTSAYISIGLMLAFPAVQIVLGNFLRYVYHVPSGKNVLRILLEFSFRGMILFFLAVLVIGLLYTVTFVALDVFVVDNHVLNEFHLYFFWELYAIFLLFMILGVAGELRASRVSAEPTKDW